MLEDTNSETTKNKYHLFEKYNTEETTIEELKDIVKQLRRRKAPGPDEIPTELIKEMKKTSIEYYHY